MTVASGTLLVVSVASLNIIWGYPWLGIFSTSVSLFVLGRLTSILMSPKLDFHLSLPRSVPAGIPLSIPINCRNRGRLPAMQFLISFDRRLPGKRLWRRRGRMQDRQYEFLTPPQPISLMESGKTQRVPSTIRFTRRGTQAIPKLITRSYFPFYLFQVTQQVDLHEEITVTPAPLDPSKDTATLGFLEALGEWSHKLLSGDALDYTGSREYQTGMPVRRWDFNSWARLGRPIVREFQSPSIQQIFLIIDTAQDGQRVQETDEWNPAFERLLSAATTTILDLTKKRVSLQLCVTCEENRKAEEGGFINVDSESMLIRLANASAMDSSLSNQQLNEALETVQQATALVLSNRDAESYPNTLPRSVTWICITDPPSESS